MMWCKIQQNEKISSSKHKKNSENPVFPENVKKYEKNT